MRLSLIACLLIAVCPYAADAQQKDTEDYIAAGWKRIVKTQADYTLEGAEPLDSDRVFLYWAQVRAACVKEFDKKEYRFHQSRVAVVPGWLVEQKLPEFEAPPIPFPDARPFPPIPKPDGPGWDDMRDLFRF